MSERIALDITQDHIDRAVEASKNPNRGRCSHCVIAQALLERFPGRNVAVGYTRAIIGTAQIPPHALDVEEAAFDLDVAGRRIAVLDDAGWSTVKPQTIFLARTRTRTL